MAEIVNEKPTFSYARQLLLVVFVGLFAVYICNGRRALYDTSEARYAEVAREMVSSGDWLVPHLLGQPHMTKPPLGYWLAAIPIELFGTAEWAARFSAGVFFLLTVIMTAELARTMWRSESAGILAAWVQLTAVFPLAAAHTVTTDVFLTAFETAGILCIWKFLRAERRLVLWQLGVGAAWGAAFLTKGPPGLVALAAVIVAAILTCKDLPWRRLLNPWTPLAFFAVALPWYLMVLSRVPNAIETWKIELLTRSFDDPDRVIPRYDYFVILTAGALPGFAALIVGLVQALRAKRLRIQLGVAEVRFLVTWLVIPFVVFVLAKRRLYLYVLPLFPVLAVASGQLLKSWWFPTQAFSWRRAPRWAILLAAVALLVVVSGRIVYAHIKAPMRNFKPLALGIAADAKVRNAKPAVLIMTRNQGMGLAYYLGDIPMRRTGSKYLQHLRRTKGGKGTQLDRALDVQTTAGMVEYLVMKDKDYRRHQDSLDEHRFGEPIVVAPWMALPRLSDAVSTGTE